MVEGYVGPSELHLKKELTALRKARCFRDPKTCSSWRSPLSTKSFAATTSILYEHETRGSTIQKGDANSPGLPPRLENRRKKVYLYNWRQCSSKSSDGGIKLEESPESCSNSRDLESRSDARLEIPVNIYNMAHSNSGIPVKRTIRRLKRSSISKKGAIKHSMVSKLLDLPSSSSAIVKTGERFHGAGSTNEITRKDSCSSPSASPLFSGPGCGSWSNPSKIQRKRREGSSLSCTPVSTSSYYRCGCRNPSTVGSSDRTAASSDGNELDGPAILGCQGCGIPCYWSKRTKERVCGSCCSPSLSDAQRRKGSRIFTGSRAIYNKKRFSSSQGTPLLNNGCDGAGSSVDSASDGLSTNLEELDLEASSRLDGRRWSSCKSQEGTELAPHGGHGSEMPDQRSLCQKYRPRSFDDIIGQNIVAQSLSNAILRGRIAPAYLFQGPRGTGKTSTARIFSAALNCVAIDKAKPCGLCKECLDFYTGNCQNLIEIDATNKNGINRIRFLLKKISAKTAWSRYMVFVVEECHMISSKIWSTFIKYLDEPLPRVVFIFTTIDPDSLPRGIVSHCQKYIFSKIKDVEIVCRLRKLSVDENLNIELDALNLIALNSDGSLRDAETMLDQLSLLGKKITTDLVNDLFGVVSDEKLLDLLEMAMSSDTAETVRRSRELMDSGVDPIALMSQLAGLIMDIIAGTYQLADASCNDTAHGGRNLTEAELERLQQALKILSDAEKQIRLSSERSTWFTAALLQLGSGQPSDQNQPRSSSSKQSGRKSNGHGLEILTDRVGRNASHSLLTVQESKRLALDYMTGSLHSSPHHGRPSSSWRMREVESFRKRNCVNPDKLAEVWKQCIEGCHSKTLRQLLIEHGRLISVGKNEGGLIAFVAFNDSSIKSRAERFLSSIMNSFEIVLRHNVEVRMGLLPEFFVEELQPNPDSQANSHAKQLRYLDAERKIESETSHRSCGNGRHRRSSDNSQTVAEGSTTVLGPRAKTMAIDEQRLESAWLQAAEKCTPGTTRRPKSEDQFLLQNGLGWKNERSSMAPESSKHWEDELNHEIISLKISETRAEQKDQAGERANGYAISPSLLHSKSCRANSDKEHLDYESGPGCNCLFCWRTDKPCRGKMKQGVHARSQKSGRLSLFGNRRRSKVAEI